MGDLEELVHSGISDPRTTDDSEPSTADLEDLAVGRLAERAGTTADVVERVASLGILRRGPRGGFVSGDIQRLRLALALERSGISLDDFARGVAAGKLSLEFAG